MVDESPVMSIQSLGLHWPTADPFLFCAYHKDHFPRGNDAMGPAASLEGRQIGHDFELHDGWRMYHGDKVPGFPVHPHRGFETITIVQDGFVDHADSLGAAGRYGKGDVQWMTAGRGIQHSEMFPLINEQSDNPVELFQIWLNLPAAGKQVEPHFTMFWQDRIPVVETTDSHGRLTSVEIIAGTLESVQALPPPPDSWAAREQNQVWVWLLTLAPGAMFELPEGAGGLNRFLYFYQGSTIEVANQSIAAGHGMQLRPDFATSLKNGTEIARLLLLQGRPIAEPVANYGPFVMNTREQLQQAFEDYQRDQFGGWPWPRQDQVHDREKGRFARFADGREETRKTRGR